mmetsp:Transcript_32689/g.56859  ORF Transcript_32689/g.56859 Transcript_32689/m.56859 type:complete len:198 (-) Transcript_32689:1074-1667(-)
MQVYLYRHAQSTFNAARLNRLLRPWQWLTEIPPIVDPPLTDKGIAQATLASLQEKALLEEVELFICSPLLRAVQTMELMTEGIERPVVITPLVKELQKYSCDMGLGLQALKAKYPYYSLEEFDQEIWWKHQPDQIYGGVLETYDELAQRIEAFQNFLRAKEVKRVAVFTHGNFMRAVSSKIVLPRHCALIEMTLPEI